jgi:Protein of unknown function (DUF3224)
MKDKTKAMSALVVASVFLLALGPATMSSFASTGASSSSTFKVSGIWTLEYLNSTVFQTKGNWQYGGGTGPGKMTGGIHGTADGEFLTAFNMKTGVILFTGQIVCVCTIHGKSGTLWISMIHGIDHNAYNPNGKTTAEFVITEASGALAGTTGHGPMKTTTSSDDMNYTMWITLG